MPYNVGTRTHSKSYRKNYRGKKREPSKKEIVKLMKRNRPEIKWYDATQTAVTQSSSPTLLAIDGVPNGTTDNQKIGSDITAKSFYQKFTLQQGSMPVNCQVRVLVFWWRGTGACSLSNILQNTGAGLGVLSPYNREYSTDFKVIFDKLYTLVAGQDAMQVDKIYKSLYRKVQFTGTSGQQTDNTLFYTFISDQTVTASMPLVTAYTRFSYIDN